MDLLLVNPSLSTLAALWAVAAVALVPLGALAARFALVPVLNAVGRMRAAGRAPSDAEERLAAVEDELRALTRAVERLAAAAERREPHVRAA